MKPVYGAAAALIAAFLLGCASAANFDDTGKSPGLNEGEVILERPDQFSGSNVKMNIFVDGQLRAIIGNAGRGMIMLPDGEHTMYAEMGRKWKSENVTVTVNSNRVTFMAKPQIVDGAFFKVNPISIEQTGEAALGVPARPSVPVSVVPEPPPAAAWPPVVTAPEASSPAASWPEAASSPVVTAPEASSPAATLSSPAATLSSGSWQGGQWRPPGNTPGSGWTPPGGAPRSAWQGQWQPPGNTPRSGWTPPGGAPRNAWQGQPPGR